MRIIWREVFRVITKMSGLQLVDTGVGLMRF